MENSKEELAKKIYTALLECWEASKGQKIVSIEFKRAGKKED